MANTNLGSNVFYFDTNGAINNGKATNIIKIAFWAVDSNSSLVMAIGTGVPAVKLSYFNFGTTVVWNQWLECNFPGKGWYITNGSILTVTAGSGYIFLA